MAQIQVSESAPSSSWWEDEAFSKSTWLRVARRNEAEQAECSKIHIRNSNTLGTENCGTVDRSHTNCVILICSYPEVPKWKLRLACRKGTETVPFQGNTCLPACLSSSYLASLGLKFKRWLTPTPVCWNKADMGLWMKLRHKQWLSYI